MARAEDLLAELSPEQFEAMGVFVEAELARREGGDFDKTVRSRMGLKRWERAILSIPPARIELILASVETKH
jgi:hypothetical protein